MPRTRRRRHGARLASAGHAPRCGLVRRLAGPNSGQHVPATACVAAGSCGWWTSRQAARSKRAIRSASSSPATSSRRRSVLSTRTSGSSSCFGSCAGTFVLEQISERLGMAARHSQVAPASRNGRHEERDWARRGHEIPRGSAMNDTELEPGWRLASERLHAGTAAEPQGGSSCRPNSNERAAESNRSRRRWRVGPPSPCPRRHGRAGITAAWPSACLPSSSSADAGAQTGKSGDRLATSRHVVAPGTMFGPHPPRSGPPLHGLQPGARPTAQKAPWSLRPATARPGSQISEPGASRTTAQVLRTRDLR